MGPQPLQPLPDLQAENLGLGKHLTKKAQENETLIQFRRVNAAK